MTAYQGRRDLLRAARANIQEARRLHTAGNLGLASALLACARDQIARAEQCPRMARYVWRTVEVTP